MADNKTKIFHKNQKITVNIPTHIITQWMDENNICHDTETEIHQALVYDTTGRTIVKSFIPVSSLVIDDEEDFIATKLQFG